MEKTGCKIICGAPATLAVKGLMMIMMMISKCVLGKTLLAKAVANQTSATFLRVVGSELIQKYLVSTFFF